jgi:hypothetical protein
VQGTIANAGETKYYACQGHAGEFVFARARRDVRTELDQVLTLIDEAAATLAVNDDGSPVCRVGRGFGFDRGLDADAISQNEESADERNYVQVQ